MRHLLRLGVIAALAVAAFAAGAGAADAGGVPDFVAFSDSPSTGPLACLRWTDERGGRSEAWTKLGGRAGDFELSAVDHMHGTLTLRQVSSGRLFTVALADGIVLPTDADAELRRLRAFLNQSGDAPVLSREQAKAFWLWLTAQTDAPTESSIVLDLDGHTLPSDQQRQYLRNAERARQKGRMLVLYRDGDDRHYLETSLNTYGMPEPFLRNLSPSEIEELSTLSALRQAQYVHAHRNG